MPMVARVAADAGGMLSGVIGCSRSLLYFRARGAVPPEPAFVDVVPIDFGIAEMRKAITTCPCWPRPDLSDFTGVLSWLVGFGSHDVQ
jgi:hypothetical protein